ncbi:MAG: hypothetical protein LQ342_004807 [Letrouitia transgressa]|nr:MAG: hypothetical protein LQ342_004807 [Letrouitia transgressa]
MSNPQSSSWSNPKKRPVGANSTDLRDPTQNDLVLAELNNGNISRPYKRSRGPDWPLKSTDKNGPYRVMNPKQKKSTSPGQKQNASAKPRNSKFVEGSMNDRVSTKPPSLYTREEQMMEQYHDQDETTGWIPVNKDSLDDNRVYHDDGIDNARPSGMYRFGRAIVSAFNPVNVWQGINGFWRDREGKVEPQKNILEERRIKAEKTYAELKKSRYKGTGKSAGHLKSVDTLNSKHEKTKEQPLGFSIRDSDVDMDENYSFSEMKPKEYTEENVLEYLAPPSFTLQGSVSPADNPRSARKSSLHLRRPSFASLKKVKSQIQLPATKHQPTASPSMACATPEVNLEQAMNHDLKKQPSKKDLAKQQRLSKRVSDLETKLDVARRELKLSLQGVPDIPEIPKSGRKSFKPGALASLPSESIINTEKILGGENDVEVKAVLDPKNLTTSVASKQTPDKPAAANAAMLEAQPFSAEQQKGWKGSAKKRKSSTKNIDSTYKSSFGGPTDSESDRESIRRSKRPRKPRKLDDVGIPKIKGSKSEKTPRSIPKLPKELKLEDEVPVPPVPPINLVFDPAKIDKEKLMAMRSVPNKDTPFGHISEDLFILRKEFPATPDSELTDYVSNLTQGKAVTEYTSTAHNDQPPSPTLCRPRSRSPTKFTPHGTATDPGTASPRDAVNSSSSSILLEKIDEKISKNPHNEIAISSESQPQPKDENKKVKRSYSKKDLEDKPLPPVQKEYYEWGPDVF